jgi:hypothetical protein
VSNIVVLARSWIANLPELSCAKLAQEIQWARETGLPIEALFVKYRARQLEEEAVISEGRIRSLRVENAALRAVVARVSTDPDYARGFLAQHERARGLDTVDEGCEPPHVGNMC